MRKLTEREQALLLRAVEMRQFREAEIALDLRLPNTIGKELEYLYELIRQNQLYVEEEKK